MSNSTLGSLPLGGHPHGLEPKPITLADVNRRDLEGIYNPDGRGYAESASYNPTGGSSYYVRGILEIRPVIAEVLTDRESFIPVLRCPSTDVPRAKQGDSLVIREKTYHVIKVEAGPNDETFLTLSLEENEFASA